MAFLSQSKAMTAVLVNSTQQPASTKGASPIREWRKPVMIWPFLLAGGRAVTDASSPLAMECTGVLLATRTPNCGRGGIIICDRCSRGKIHVRGAGVGNAAVDVWGIGGGTMARKRSKS